MLSGRVEISPREGQDGLKEDGRRIQSHQGNKAKPAGGFLLSDGGQTFVYPSPPQLSCLSCPGRAATVGGPGGSVTTTSAAVLHKRSEEPASSQKVMGSKYSSGRPGANLV